MLHHLKSQRKHSCHFSLHSGSPQATAHIPQGDGDDIFRKRFKKNHQSEELNGTNGTNSPGWQQAAETSTLHKSRSHLGDLPHVLNGGPFIRELGKYFLNFGNEAVDVEVGLGPALREVELWNAFAQRCGDGLLRPHLRLRDTNTHTGTVSHG